MSHLRYSNASLHSSTSAISYVVGKSQSPLWLSFRLRSNASMSTMKCSRHLVFILLDSPFHASTPSFIIFTTSWSLVPLMASAPLSQNPTILPQSRSLGDNLVVTMLSAKCLPPFNGLISLLLRTSTSGATWCFHHHLHPHLNQSNHPRMRTRVAPLI